jgi:hypothetical protein
MKDDILRDSLAAALEREMDRDAPDSRAVEAIAFSIIRIDLEFAIELAGGMHVQAIERVDDAMALLELIRSWRQREELDGWNPGTKSIE